MKISEQAAIELKKALESFDKPGSAIHFYSTPGCCGPSIGMDITTHAKKGEISTSIEGVDIFVTEELLIDLKDVTIEYGESGFLLKGLKKSSGCCG